MSRFILIGLVEPPTPEDQEKFDEWYLNQHVYDTALCPNFLAGTVYKLAGGHAGSGTTAQYLAVYEVNADSYEEAEKTLNEWQADPDAWEGRKGHRDTMASYDGVMPMAIKGSGWYEFERAFHTRG
jgi:hypothetical protein